MVKSKPSTLRMTLMIASICVTVGPFCLLVLEWIFGGMGFNVVAQSMIIVFTIIAGLFFIVTELPKALAITLDANKIEAKNLLTGKARIFPYETIDSFKILIRFASKSGMHYDLILLNQTRVVESISLSYVDNLNEIIKELEKRLQNLTEDEYGFLRTK